MNAVGVGSTTITATTTGTGKTTATCDVEVSSDCEEGLLEIALNSNEEKIYRTSSLTLSANILTANPCDSEILWSSSDETVATVVDGVVTPKKYGTTIIRATARQNENSYDECEVEVVEKEVTSVEISSPAKMMYVGGTLTLSAEVLPLDADDKTITWSTSDAEIATVTQKGVVTGVASGSVKIFAFAYRNEYALAIDYEQAPPMFRITDTHYAATWLLDPRAPKIERPVGGSVHG